MTAPETLAAALALSLLAAPALAGEPAVTAAVATQGPDGTWTFAVTVAHADEGWDHYADAFTIETPDGAELGRRVLHHPHVDEQPFTRALRGVTVPEGTWAVFVRAHDSVHGAGAAVSVALAGGEPR